jgi:hypothetical protein
MHSCEFVLWNWENSIMHAHRDASLYTVPSIEERPTLEDAQGMEETLAQEDARVQEDESVVDTPAEDMPVPVPDPPSVVLLCAWGELLGELDDLRCRDPE